MDLWTRFRGPELRDIPERDYLDEEDTLEFSELDLEDLLELEDEGGDLDLEPAAEPPTSIHFH